MNEWDSAIADYNAALKIDPKLAPALYGRGFAEIKKGNSAGGNADIAAAKSTDPNIAEEFSRYGLK